MLGSGDSQKGSEVEKDAQNNSSALCRKMISGVPGKEDCEEIDLDVNGNEEKGMIKTEAMKSAILSKSMISNPIVSFNILRKNSVEVENEKGDTHSKDRFDHHHPIIIC